MEKQVIEQLGDALYDALTTGTPGLITPAFSNAILSSVSPSHAM